MAKHILAFSRRKSAMALVLSAYVAIQALAISSAWFPADDMQELVFVRTLKSSWQLLGVDVFGLFRPVKNLLFLLFSVLEPVGMPAVRAVAIAIGVVTFFPVRAFFLRVFRDERCALLASAIWLLSPTLVSSVAWLSCVNIQLMCGFAAGAFVCHDSERPFGAALLLFIACVSYECAVAVGPCLVVFDFFLRAEKARKRETWLCYALYAFVTVAFLALRQACGSVHSVSGSIANCSRADVVFASAYLSCQHFLSWLWPFGRMTVFGGYAAGSVSATWLIGAWAVIGGAALLSLVLRRSCPVAAFGIALMLVGFLPVSNVTGIGNGPYGDYYLGISSLGLASILVSACYSRIGRLAVGLLRGAAIVAAFHWAWLWSDGDRAFSAGAENFPGFFGNKIILASRSADAGDFANALELGRQIEAVVGAHSGQMSVVYLVRGLYELRETKNAARALESFAKSRKCSDFSDVSINRDYYVGCVYDDLMDDKAQAERFYASSLRGQWTRDSVPAANRLAIIKATNGKFTEAIDLWVRALRICPADAEMQHNLSLALSRRQ